MASALVVGLVTLVSPSPPAHAASAAGEYVPLSPSRILDTRNGAGAVGANASIDVQVGGQGGVPTTNVVAVVVDVTAIPTGQGWGLTWQTGIPRPSPASTLNYVPGRPVTNTVTTQISTAGKASYYSYQSSADVIVDVVGYYRASPGGSGYNPLTQTRILDTRTTAKLVAGQTLDLRLRGAGGVPDSAAVTAVAINLSAFEEDAAGFAKVWPRGQAAPNTSNLNFAATRMQTALVEATVSADGWISLYTSTAINVLVDVVGYYTAGSGNRYVPVTSSRIIDTRYNIPGYGIGPLTQPLAPNTTTAIQLTGVGGVPATGVSAVAINATVDNPSAVGFLSAWATGDQQPGTISLTYYTGEITANLIFAKVGPDGKANITNYYGSAPLVLDVVGYYTTQATPSPPTNVAAAPANQAATLAWGPPASDGGSAVDGYLVRTYTAASPRIFVSETTTCATCTSATVPGLTNGQSYQFDILARNAGGYGAPASSNVVTPTAADPMAGAGERSDFTQQSFALTDHMTAKANVGTGNLELAVTDLVLPAVGGSLPLGHVYNSLAGATGASDALSVAFGYGFRFNQAPDVRLVPGADGSVAYDTPSANVATFTASGSTFRPPPGIDATLARAGDGTFSLSFHASAEVLAFAADGKLLKDADRNANHVDFAYPDGRRVTTIVATAGTAPGNTATIDYSGPNGHVATLSQTADGVTRTVRYGYDPTGMWLTSVTDTALGVTTFAYDGASNLVQVTDPANRVTSFVYDTAHRVTSLTRVITGGNAVTGYDYSTPGHTKVTDADGHPPVDYTVDASGRVTGATDAFNKATATTYTPDAKVGTATNAAGGMTTNSYPVDVNNGESLTQTQQGTTGAKVSATYHSPGQPFLPDSVTNTMGNASAFLYSGPGNLASTANAMAATARLSYNPDGTVATATSPANAVTTYVPNGVHQLASVTPPAPPAGGTLGPESFTYDGAGRLKTSVTGAGETTTHTYDGLDRVLTEVHTGPVAAPNISYVYDPAGNLTSRSDATGTTGFIYDEANRLRTKNLGGGGTLSYTYDAVGNLATATDAAGTTTYHYNKANLVDQITEVGGRTDVLAYDADHRRTDTWDATNGPVTYDVSGSTVIAPTGFAAHIHASFDIFGHLTGLRTTRASSDAAANRVADLSYSYAVASGTTCAAETPGNTNLRQSVTDNVTGAVSSYCYDRAARLTNAATGGGPTYAYGYDDNGNRQTGPEGAHTFNAVNQATDASSAYDANGNLTASAAYPAGTSPPSPGLAYNGVDQTTSITAVGQSPLALAYAGTTNDERTGAGTTTYQNGLLGVQSQATAGTTSTFVRDPQGTLVAERIGTNEYYYAFDATGSVIALIDATGTQRAVYTYDPYGGHATATAMNGTLPANPWRYAGGALDATGLYHFGARYYDPSIGRWTQQDSVDSLGDPANANRYAYAGDDPVNEIDPFGRNAFSDYLTGADSEKKATDPNYDNPFSNVEDSAAAGARAVGDSAGVAAGGCGAVLLLAQQSGQPELALGYFVPEAVPYAGAIACAAGAGLAAGGVDIQS